MNRHRTLTMLRAPLIALIATGGLTGAGASLAGAHTGDRPASLCLPKPLTVNGHQAIEECGSATATLHLRGHTYRFKGGACLRTRTHYLVALGTIVRGDLRHNEGRTSFDLDLSKSKQGVLGAYVGGEGLTLTVPLITASTDSASHGTFTSRREPDSSVTYHGSWNCHGSLTKLG